MNQTSQVRLTLQIVLPLVIIAAGIAGMFFLKSLKTEVESAPPVIPPPLVTVIEVESGERTLSVMAQGTVVPRTKSDLVAEVSGRLIEVSPNLVNGGYVQEGELLIRIDPRDYALAVAQARLSVAQAKRRLEEERADAAVAVDEWNAMGKGEPSPLTLRKPQVAEAEANLAAASAQLEGAELDLSRTEVMAPFAARVREKLVDLGQFVSRGQTLATGYGIAFAEVRLPLPNSDLAFLDLSLFSSNGADDGPRVALWADFGGKRQTWEGRIVRTEGQIDPRTRMIIAVAEVADPYSASSDDALRAPLAVGMFVHAEIEGRSFENVIVLPRAAMRDADTVYTIDDENRLHMRRVVLTRAGRKEVVVASGLPAGERVVISPIEIVTEGMLVRVEGEEPPTLDEAVDVEDDNEPASDDSAPLEQR